MNKWKTEMEQKMQKMETEIAELRDLVDALMNCHVSTNGHRVYRAPNGELRIVKNITHVDGAEHIGE